MKHHPSGSLKNIMVFTALASIMLYISMAFFQAGCVHFPPVPQCDVKVLLLIFSPKKRAFVGLIPNEQVSRVQRSIKT